MATETRAASSWSSIARSGDTGLSWTGISTAANAIDTNYVIHKPWVPGPPPPSPQSEWVAANAPTLRIVFAAFSLPVTDAIISATLSVRHRQNNPSFTPGSTLVWQSNAGDVTLGTSFVTSTQSVSGLSIATLNAGTGFVDLFYRGGGGPVSLLDNEVTEAAIDFVQLEVVTAAPTFLSSSDSVFVRIPNIGLR